MGRGCREREQEEEEVQGYAWGDVAAGDVIGKIGKQKWRKSKMRRDES